MPGYVFNGNPIIYSVSPLTAKQGDTVTITGKYLAPGVGILPTFISFGGVPATAIIGVNGFNSPAVKAVVGNGASGNVFLTSGYTNTSTTFPGFVFEQNCAVTSTTNVAICASALPYSWNGKNIATAGSYTDSLKSIAGCDSIATLNLVVNAASVSTIDTVICSSKLPYSWNGLSLSSQGTYNVTLTNAVGCDSIATLHLVIALCTPQVIPTITSFSPTSGPVGTTVTIIGTNFSNTAANNIVYFGAVKGNVINSTASSLNVIVPAGASYLPITVTVNGLTAYSSEIFDLTFTDNDTAFTASSFAPKNDFVTDSMAQAPYVSDLNGDGLPDIVDLNLQYYKPYDASTPKSISILKNENGVIFDNLSNAPLSSVINTGEGRGVVVKDLDGDGKPDIAISQGVVTVFRNTSSIGSISFAPRNDSIAYWPFSENCDGISMIVQDLDGDGKPDIAVADSCYGILIYRNISTIGNISFDTVFAIPGINFYGGSHLSVSDIDGDGKPDLISDRGSPQIFRNTSTIGNISFASGVSINLGRNILSDCVADFDGDNKPDIAVVGCADSLSILRNTSVPGSISFDPKINNYAIDKFSACWIYNNLATADLNGDNKPDIVVSNFYTNTVSVLKNQSSPGVISFQPQVHYATGSQPAQIYVNDINGDGKPDIEVANSGTNTISVLLNQIGYPIKTQLCPPIGNTELTSNLTGINYQWQLNTGTSFNNITYNNNYILHNDSMLILNNIPSSYYGYQFRCVVDGNNGDVYTLKFADTWISTTDSTWENGANWSCGTVPDSNTDVIINSGTVVLRSNVVVRSLTVSPNTNFTIMAGNKLTITH